MDEYLNSGAVTRYFSGDADPDEAIALHEWVGNSVENRKAFHEIYKIWYASAKSLYKAPETGNSWEEINQQLTPKGNHAANTRTVQALFWKIAASFLGITLVTFMMFYFSTNSRSTVFKETMVTKGSDKQSIQLPDNSSAFLPRSSTIRYPEIFSKKVREVLLTGDAYFQVQHLKHYPFVVLVADLQIRVLGTSFAVSHDSLKNNINVLVETGIVRISNGADSTTVYAGQTASYSATSKKFAVTNSINVNEFGYATHKFYFEDRSLQEITHYLESAFSVKFNFANESLRQCRITARFENETLEQVLNVLAATLKIEYTFEYNTVNFRGDGCR